MFYKLNSAKVTLREFWFETKFFFWAGMIIKLGNMRLRGSTDDLAVDSLHPFEVDPSTIPPDMMRRFEPVMSELQQRGFGQPIWHFEEDVLQATRNTMATLLHESGRSMARVQCRVNFGRVPPKVKFFTTLISKTSSGFVVTGNGKYDMAWPDSHDVLRRRRMSIPNLCALHQTRLGTKTVQAVRPGQLPNVLEEYHQSLRDFHLARGVFEPIETNLAFTPPLPAVDATSARGEIMDAIVLELDEAIHPPPDLMELATLDELRQLQNAQANWRFSAILLLFSAALFIIQSRTSDRQQSWEFVAILVGVLLVHELGHYLAMKVFGYRNLRMFFIPGFGAAVSGRHYNAPAWKKILVSLMGPLPGIVLGAVALTFAEVRHIDLLYRVGLLAIIINAFNLIPVLPLDGGWVAHAAVFSRNPKLDVGFRFCAAIILIIGGLKLPGMKLLGYVGAATLFTLPLASRLAMVVAELRKVPGLGVSPDSQTIPTETARIILQKIRDRFPRNLNAKLAARHVASVFESLNSRPPSAGATFGLLTLHAGGFIFALLALLIGIGVHNRLFNRALLAGIRPEYQVAPHQIQSLDSPTPEMRNTIVMRFRTQSAAQEAFENQISWRPRALFGQTVLVAFSPAQATDQRSLFNTFQSQVSDIFVDSSKLHAQVDLSAKPDDTPACQQAVNEIEAYLSESSWELIPPWASEQDWPTAQRAVETQLRQLLKELRSAPATFDPQETAIWKKIAEAERTGDTDAANRLEAQLKRIQEQAREQHRQQLKQKFGHTDLIDRYTQISAEKDFKTRQKQLKAEFAPLLGQWPAGKPPELLARNGFAFPVTKGDLMINSSFQQIETGLPAMTRWMFAHGFSDMRYRITGTPVSEQFDTEGGVSPD